MLADRPRLSGRGHVFLSGFAVAAAAGLRGAEAAVAAVAVSERMAGGYGCACGRRGVERGWWRQLGGQTVGKEGCRAVQGLVRQVAGQGVAYGGGGQVPLQPGGDAGGEVFGVGGGEEEAGVRAAEAGEDIGGCVEEGGGAVRGLRYGGEGAAALRFLLRGGGRAAGRGLGCLARFGRGIASAGLVAGDRAGDDPAGRGAFAGAAQVAVGL